ncbi:MAG: hemolysin family protein [Methanomassiliicoccaceae archaeon]|nr:hemolysin family protein [Methanomassiliicoccaceae archaeon]
MDDLFVILFIVILAALVCLSAFFGAAETAYSSMNRIRLKNYAKEGNKKAEKALRISENYDRLITTILIANTFVNFAAVTLSGIIFAYFIVNENLAAAVSTIAITLIVLTFGEVTPKCVAKSRAERMSMTFARAMSVVIYILYPLSVLFVGLRKLLTRSIPETDEPTMTEEELIVMIDEIEGEGTIEKHESDLIKSAIEFDDVTVGELYTPRVDVTAVEITADKEQIKRTFRDAGFSRIPVYKETIDQIVGVIYSKDFYNSYLESAESEIRNIVRPVKFVPTTMKVSLLLKDLQKSKMHMAVVVDQYGGTVGIVTLEDIIEELVGEIWDESDEIEHQVTERLDGSSLALGGANIRDVLEGMDMEQDLGDYEGHTVGGFILHRLGRIPMSGDTVEIKGAKLTVRVVKNRRIRDVIITKAENKEEGADKREDEN